MKLGSKIFRNQLFPISNRFSIIIFLFHLFFHQFFNLFIIYDLVFTFLSVLFHTVNTSVCQKLQNKYFLSRLLKRNFVVFCYLTPRHHFFGPKSDLFLEWPLYFFVFYSARSNFFVFSIWYFDIPFTCCHFDFFLFI